MYEQETETDSWPRETPFGKVKVDDVRELEKRLGFSLNDAKRAKQLHEAMNTQE